MSDGKKYDNSGALYVNDKKQNDKHPDRNGSAMIDGVEYWISGWIKEGKSGKFMSLAFRRKDEQQGGGSRPASQRSEADEFF